MQSKTAAVNSVLTKKISAAALYEKLANLDDSISVSAASQADFKKKNTSQCAVQEFSSLERDPFSPTFYGLPTDSMKLDCNIINSETKFGLKNNL